MGTLCAHTMSMALADLSAHSIFITLWSLDMDVHKKMSSKKGQRKGAAGGRKSVITIWRTFCLPSLGDWSHSLRPERVLRRREEGGGGYPGERNIVLSTPFAF